MIDFCIALIVAGLIFLLMGIGGTIGLRIPQLGYVGGPTGVVLILLGFVFKMMGFC